jgi:hypothetical protein
LLANQKIRFKPLQFQTESGAEKKVEGVSVQKHGKSKLNLTQEPPDKAPTVFDTNE